MLINHLSVFIKCLSKSNLLRLFILGVLVLYAYSPFMLGTNLGAGDAYWYYTALRDSLDQVHKGIFPIYLGQGIFNYLGIPVIRAPYYFLLGQWLDLLTLGKMNALFIQHFTILFSAFFSAFLSYFLFIRVIPVSKWAALFIAFFYVSCPGVIGLIYFHDMYHSFMCLPFVPLLLYGLFKIYQTDEISSYILVSVSLSLLWMCHPPIALWLTAISIFFCGVHLVFRRRSFFKWLIIPILSLGLSLWQFASVYSLKIGSEYVGNQDARYPDAVIGVLKEQLPGAFLPLGLRHIPLELQLGYSLWLAFFVGIIISFLAKDKFILKLFSLFFIGISLFLYPLPIVGHWLWSLTPTFVRNITIVFAYQRFYIILAGLACFLALMSLRYLFSLSYRHIKPVLYSILVVLCFWNLIQVHQIKIAFPHSTDKNWLDPHNLYLLTQYSQGSHSSLFSGVYDPQLKNKLLDAQQKPLSDGNNEQIMAAYCLKHAGVGMSGEKVTLLHHIPSIVQLDLNESLPLFRFSILPEQKYLICLNMQMKSSGLSAFRFEAWGDDFPVRRLNPVSENSKNVTRTLLFPIITSKDSSATDLTAQIVMESQLGGTIQILSYAFIHYNYAMLPIKIQSMLPYEAQLISKNSGNYLEIFKEFYPGYEATVNNVSVSVLASPDHLIMIPLIKGKNEIILKYNGTFLMKISFYISATMWVLLIMYFIFLAYHRESASTKRSGL